MTRHFLAIVSFCALVALPALAARPPVHYRLVRTIPLAGDLGWDYLTLDSINRRLYVTRSTHVDVFDADSGLLVGQITQTNGVHGVAVAPTLGLGWTSNGTDNTVTTFDLHTLAPIGYIAVGTRPDCIVYDPATKRVFTFNGGSHDATAIDAVTGRVLGTVPLGGKPEFAVVDGQGKVFDNIEDTSEVVALDTRALTVTQRWPIAPVINPSGIALDAPHHRLFSVGDNGKMAVLDADTGQVVATPAIGHGPDACAFDPITNVAFSSNGRDGTLTLVQEQPPQTFSVVDTVPTQAGARTMVLDLATHHVFLITAQFALPAPGDSPLRRVILPGTVVLLEYAPTSSPPSARG